MYSFSKLKGYNVVTTKPEKLGQIKDMIVDTKTWQIKGFLLSKGMFKEDTFCPMKVVKNIDFGERSVYCYSLIRGSPWIDERIRPEDMHLSEILHTRAFSKEKSEAGLVYDCIINTANVPWKVESLSIDQGLMKNAYRVSTSKIDGITEDRIRLNLRNIDIDVEKRNQFLKIENLREQVVQEKMVVEKKYSTVYSIISNLETRLNSYRSKELNAVEKIADNKETIKDLQTKRKRTMQDLKSTKRLFDDMQNSIDEIHKEMDKKRKIPEQDQQVMTRLQQLGKEMKAKESNLKEIQFQLKGHEKLGENLDLHAVKLKDGIKDAEIDIRISRDIAAEMEKDLEEQRKEKERLKKEHIHLEKKVLRHQEHSDEILTDAMRKK